LPKITQIPTAHFMASAWNASL